MCWPSRCKILYTCLCFLHLKLYCVWSMIQCGKVLLISPSSSVADLGTKSLIYFPHTVLLQKLTNFSLSLYLLFRSAVVKLLSSNCPLVWLPYHSFKNFVFLCWQTIIRLSGVVFKHAPRTGWCQESRNLHSTSLSCFHISPVNAPHI